MFAKLYESSVYGQILVKRGSDDNGDAEVRFYFKPPAPELELCSTAFAFYDSEGADKLFEQVTLESAEEVVGNLIAEFENMVGRDEGD